MLEKSKAIVLRTQKYGDDSLIAELYTQNRGAVPFMVKLPKSKKSSLKSVFLRPMTLLEVDFEIRPKAALQKIKDMSLYYPYSSLPYHPYKSAMILFLSEFVAATLRHEPANPSLFEYLTHSLMWLDTCQEGYVNFHLFFIMKMTRFLGFYPRVSVYRDGFYFDMQQASFVAERPVHTAYLEPQEARFVPMMLRMNLDTMRHFVFTRAQRNRFLTVLNDYYKLHLPDFPDMKSIEILKEIFS